MTDSSEDIEICPGCGNPALRVDVGIIGMDCEDWIPGVPEGAEDCCVAAHGFQTMTPIGGVMIGWHGELITRDKVKQCEHGIVAAQCTQCVLERTRNMGMYTP